MNAETESLNTKQQDLDELTYIISHDLQEPLRMITSYVQLLNKRYSDKLDDNAREYIGYAVDGSNRLKKMMDDLLTYSRVGRPDFTRENLDINEIIDKLKKQISSKYPGKEGCIRLTNSNTAVINADKQLLLKMLYSMADNSLKFNNSDNPLIDISVNELDDGWNISVSDNGMGIEKEYHGKIFGIFQKLHSHADYPGSGIGLALCEKIANRHNGEISLESEPGKGATFHVNFKKES